MDECRISNNDHIIIYGRESVLFTPRIWFMFKSFGHDPSKLHLMQGSLEEWIHSGGEVEYQETKICEAKDILNKVKQKSNDQTKTPQFKYIAKKQPSYVFTMEDVLETVNDQGEEGDIGENNYIIIDSRGSSFVNGNIPNSVHIPYNKFMSPNNSLKMLSKDELLTVFDDAGVDPCTEEKIVCSCGSGVSACTVFLALNQCGRNIDEKPTFMYDGSWSEWGKDPSTPKVITIRK